MWCRCAVCKPNLIFNAMGDKLRPPRGTCGKEQLRSPSHISNQQKSVGWPKKIQKTYYPSLSITIIHHYYPSLLSITIHHLLSFPQQPTISSCLGDAAAAPQAQPQAAPFPRCPGETLKPKLQNQIIGS